MAIRIKSLRVVKWLLNVLFSIHLICTSVIPVEAQSLSSESLLYIKAIILKIYNIMKHFLYLLEKAGIIFKSPGQVKQRWILFLPGYR